MSNETNERAERVVEWLDDRHRGEIVTVLADAFRAYPVMRWVLGDDVGDPRRLARLVELFAAGRLLRGEPVLGVVDPQGELVGVALLTTPGEHPLPAAHVALRELVWGELGVAARRRYEAFGAAAERLFATSLGSLGAPAGRLDRLGSAAAGERPGLERAEPVPAGEPRREQAGESADPGQGSHQAPLRHHHLNMLAVRRAAQGKGWSRRLLDAVHQLAAADPLSAGVTLTTEASGNLPLYEHFGYRVLGQAEVAPELTTWALFRPSRRRRD
jgi:GNAT superfamily N-acetyltransferase